MQTAPAMPNLKPDVDAIAGLLVEALVAVEARTFADDVTAAVKLGQIVDHANAATQASREHGVLDASAATRVFDVATSAQQIQTRLHSGQAQPVAALLPGVQPDMPTAGCLDDEEFVQARTLITDMQRDVAALSNQLS